MMKGPNKYNFKLKLNSIYLVAMASFIILYYFLLHFISIMIVSMVFLNVSPGPI